MKQAPTTAIKPVHPVTARDLLRCCARERMALQDAEEAIRRGHILAIANYTTYVKAGGAWQTDVRTQITDTICTTDHRPAGEYDHRCPTTPQASDEAAMARETRINTRS